MNTVMLDKRCGVALRSKARERDGVVPREEVAKVVKELMGREKGEAARKIRESTAQLLASDGPACRALQAVASKWEKGMP
ncbi:hydroquinone glucosyltransferase [Hordeum vulgare]|nr:hydroquinone glucosyltransferase [Hordeum vulgare]